MMRNDRPRVFAGLGGWLIGAAVTASLGGCGPAPAPRQEGPAAPKEYLFMPPPPQVPRMQFLCNLHGSRDFATPRQRGLAEFVVGGDLTELKNDTVGKPFGVAARGGRVFVSDTKEARICVFDIVRNRFETFGTKGRGALRKPINVRLDEAGLLYVTDMIRGQIVVFDENGKYVTEYGKGDEFRPADVIVSGEELYVLDIGAHNIKVYDRKTRKLKRTLGKRGPGFGEFNFPTNMVMDAAGNIHVCDSMNIRVQKIDTSGKSLSIFGRPGRTPGHFARPRGIAVDREGIVYVVDSMMGIVQLFDPNGVPLLHIGGMGTGDGQLYLPAQVTISYDSVEAFGKYIAPNFEAKYLVFVTNQLGPNKVSVFAFGKGRVATGAEQPATRPKQAGPGPTDARRLGGAGGP